MADVDGQRDGWLHAQMCARVYLDAVNEQDRRLRKCACAQQDVTLSLDVCVCFCVCVSLCLDLCICLYMCLLTFPCDC